MNITADTNVLVRAVTGDDAAQAAKAAACLESATLIAVTLPTLCEFAWVLRRVYSFAVQDIATAIRTLLNTEKIYMDSPAVEAGLAVLEAGGDFADGVIAFLGRRLGGETFLSFDQKAIALLNAQGYPARQP